MPVNSIPQKQLKVVSQLEKRVFLIPLFCALSFAYMGFRYGMYSYEGWVLTYKEGLEKMLVWGVAHSIVFFLLMTFDMFVIIRNTKNYETKLFSLVFSEVLGIGVPSGIVIIKGLIADPWYLPTLALVSGVTSLMAILYVNIAETRRRKDNLSQAQDKMILERLKLEHKKHLQYFNSMTWIVVFSLFAYLSSVFLVSRPNEPFIPILFVVNVVGIVYFVLGLAFGVLWQMIMRIGQIEDMIAALNENVISDVSQEPT